MKEEFVISIHQKQNNTPESTILDQLVQNFDTCYSISTQSVQKDGILHFSIQFLEPSEIELRTEGIIEIAEHFLRAFSDYEEIDRFQYFQRVLDHRAKQSGSNESYLIIKYQTNMQEKFRNYYQFLNRFFPILNTLCYIEEVKEGFLLFFEREQDFHDYLFNITSEQSFREMLQCKEITLPKEFFARMVSVVQKKLLIL